MIGETVSREEASRQVKLALRRLAMYHGAMVEVMKEELGEAAGRALAEKVADRYGSMVGLAALARAEEAGKSNDLANYAEDLPGLGFDMEKTSDDPLTVRVHGCPLAQTWREMGCQADGAIYCRVDQAKYLAYNPAITCCHRVHAIKDDSPFCELTMEQA